MRLWDRGGLSAPAADVMFGVPPDGIDAGFLAGFTRRLTNALGDDGLAQWALNALLTYPTTPDFPELEFDLPMPGSVRG